MIDICRLVMSASYDNMVPGESCFNLNFSNPGGSGPAQSLLISSSSSNKTIVASDTIQPQSTMIRTSRKSAHHSGPTVLPNGKKTKGRVKIKMEYIGNKLRRYTTFSKRKTGIMKKAYELSTLTGTQVMLLVASETGHVYTFATKKLQPMITSEAGKALIQTCLNTPDSGIDTADGCSEDFTTFAPSTGKKRKHNHDEDTQQNVNGDLPTMVHTAPRSPDDDSDSGEFDTHSDSPLNMSNGVASLQGDSDDSSSDDGETDAVGAEHHHYPNNGQSNINNSIALQQTIKEVLRQAAAAHHHQNNNNTNVNSQQLNALFPMLPGFASSSSQSNNGSGAIMYQMPQGVVYTTNANDTNNHHSNSTTNGGGLFINVPTSSENGAGKQFITIPITPLSLQQMMTNVAQQMSSTSDSTPNTG